MAHIDVQKKRGINPIWWIIGLIVAIAIIWWIVAANNDRDVVDQPAGAITPTVTPTPTATTMSPVGDIAVIVGVPDATGFVGRPVSLQDVQVQSVVSDKGFWVGPSDAQRVFVALDEVRTPSTATEGRYDVTAGQHLAVFGTVQQMPADLSQASTTWNLNSTDASALANQQIYIRADSLQIQ